MSASKIGKSDPFKPVSVKGQALRLDLTANAVRIRKNGIEFQTGKPIQAWTEMTVMLESPDAAEKFEGNGVVVACNGNRHSGFVVSVVFTNLSLPDQARLQLLAFSTLA